MITVKAIYEQGRVEFLEPVPQIERALVAVIFLDIDPVEALVASYGSLLEGMIWGEPMDEEGARALVEVHEELLPYSLEVEETYRRLRQGAEGQGAWELRSRSPERSEGTGAEERRR